MDHERNEGNDPVGDLTKVKTDLSSSLDVPRSSFHQDNVCQASKVEGVMTGTPGYDDGVVTANTPGVFEASGTSMFETAAVVEDAGEISSKGAPGSSRSVHHENLHGGMKDFAAEEPSSKRVQSGIPSERSTAPCGISSENQPSGSSDISRGAIPKSRTRRRYKLRSSSSGSPKCMSSGEAEEEILIPRRNFAGSPGGLVGRLSGSIEHLNFESQRPTVKEQYYPASRLRKKRRKALFDKVRQDDDEDEEDEEDLSTSPKESKDIPKSVYVQDLHGGSKRKPLTSNETESESRTSLSVSIPSLTSRLSVGNLGLHMPRPAPKQQAHSSAEYVSDTDQILASLPPSVHSPLYQPAMEAAGSDESVFLPAPLAVEEFTGFSEDDVSEQDTSEKPESQRKKEMPERSSAVTSNENSSQSISPEDEQSSSARSYNISSSLSSDSKETIPSIPSD